MRFLDALYIELKDAGAASARVARFDKDVTHRVIKRVDADERRGIPGAGGDGSFYSATEKVLKPYITSSRPMRRRAARGYIRRTPRDSDYANVGAMSRNWRR